MRGIGYVRKDNKLGMVQDDYKLGDSLNGVATHEFCPYIRNYITKVESAMTIKYDEVVSNNVDDDDV